MPESTPAWIQAFAAIAQVVLAFVLWRATSRYVGLTQQLSFAADRQLDILRLAQAHTRRSDLVELSALCQRLVASMRELPETGQTPNWGTALITAPLWSVEDTNTLAKLAAKAGQEYAHRVALVVNDLEWLRVQLQVVRAEDPRLGYALSNFPWEPYVVRRTRAVKELENMAAGSISDANALDAS